MTFPVYLRVGGLAVHPHIFFEGLAYAVGLYWCSRARRAGGDLLGGRARWTLVAAALVGGFAGSRLLAALEDPAVFQARWWDPQFLLSGKTIVGGLLGGVLAVEATKRWLRIKVATGDLFTLPLIAGLAIGRIGCFLTGLDDQSYGVPTRLPWGVDFGDGVARHPAQLYEVVFLIALASLIMRLYGRLPVGDAFKLFLLAYVAFRLLVDFIKPGLRVGGLSVIQWACVATLAFYAPHAGRLMKEVRGE